MNAVGMRLLLAGQLWRLTTWGSLIFQLGRKTLTEDRGTTEHGWLRLPI